MDVDDFNPSEGEPEENFEDDVGFDNEVDVPKDFPPQRGRGGRGFK